MKLLWDQKLIWVYIKPDFSHSFNYADILATPAMIILIFQSL